jgi:hypothetical protein
LKKGRKQYQKENLGHLTESFDPRSQGSGESRRTLLILTLTTCRF